MTRRTLLSALAASPLALAKRVDRSRFSAITDEIGHSPGESLAFASQYGLKWLELRGVPAPGGRREYFALPESDLREAAKQFAGAGVRISFLNTSMLKYTLPGTEPANPRAPRTSARFDKRMEELKQAIGAAHILGASKIRIFTFTRAAQPAALYPRIADLIGEMCRVAEKEKVKLLVENEGSQNAATCSEIAELVKMIPSPALGINWDPLNGSRGEKPFPDGYDALPAKRIWNVQVKGRNILPGPDRIDWGAIFARLARDGYKGQIGLETHMGRGDELIRNSHDAMREMIRLTSAT
jgi:sugar phosphate isomerase/epimerase